MTTSWLSTKLQRPRSWHLPEPERNRLLRRVDWRFLLPDAAPEGVWCAAGGDIRRAMELLWGDVHDASRGGRADCDLAVAIDPDHLTLSEMRAALRPGGACYVEWSSVRAGGARGVRRRLEAAGFEQVRCYTPLPSLRRCQLWLPLDEVGASAFFRKRPASSRRILRRIRLGSARLAARVRLRLGLSLPIGAVARRPGPPGTAEPGAIQAIRGGWAAGGLGAAPGKLSWLLLTGGPRSISKIVGLVFAEPEPQPRAAVKIARVPESVDSLRREAATLRWLHREPDSLPGIPRVLFHEERNGTAVLGETALSGVPLSSLLRRRNFRRLALQVTDWSAEMALRTRGEPPADHRSGLARRTADDFREKFGPVLDPSLLGRAEDALLALEGLPQACEQRDFSPWNILAGPDGSLIVLDWESADPHGMPALDLIYFLTFWGFYLDDAMRSGRFAESYRRGLDPTTFTGRVWSECMTRYLDRLGMGIEVVPPLRLLTWMLHARSEHERIVADAGGPPAPELLRRSRFLRLWQEELRSGPIAGGGYRPALAGTRA
jgi:hypothetical protein